MLPGILRMICFSTHGANVEASTMECRLLTAGAEDGSSASVTLSAFIRAQSIAGKVSRVITLEGRLASHETHLPTLP